MKVYEHCDDCLLTDEQDVSETKTVAFLSTCLLIAMLVILLLAAGIIANICIKCLANRQSGVPLFTWFSLTLPLLLATYQSFNSVNVYTKSCMPKRLQNVYMNIAARNVKRLSIFS